VSDLVGRAGYSLDSVLCTGAVMALAVKWNCDFDKWSVGDQNNKYCEPGFSFVRLDDPYQTMSSGFNFYQAKYYKTDGTVSRELLKRFGLRLVVQVTGTGSGYSSGAMAASIFLGIASLVVARVICDFLAMIIIDNAFCSEHVVGWVNTKEIMPEKSTTKKVPNGHKHMKGDDMETVMLRRKHKKDMRDDGEAHSDSSTSDDEDELDKRPPAQKENHTADNV